MHHRPVNWMDNPNAERVKRVAQLAVCAALRNRRKQFLAEGPQAAAEAIRAHLALLELSGAAAQLWPPDQTVAAVYYSQQLADSHPELAELVGQLSVSVFVAQSSD